MSDLTLAQRSTLKEMAGYAYGYSFRQAASKKLVALGLAQILPGEEKKKRPMHIITALGLTVLRSLP